MLNYSLYSFSHAQHVQPNYVQNSATLIYSYFLVPVTDIFCNLQSLVATRRGDSNPQYPASRRDVEESFLGLIC